MLWYAENKGLLLAFDDDNDARLHEIYQTIICQVDDDLPENFEELVILD